MKENQMYLINKIFNNENIRTVWDKEEEKYYISVVDVVSALTESKDFQSYWRKLKQRLKAEGNESVTNCHGLKLKAKDGKYRLGFPKHKIDAIILKLKELKINYKLTTLINYSKNNYFDILNQANENIEFNDKIKFINHYLQENPNKIEKIYNLCMKN